MNPQAIADFTNNLWDSAILPALHDYIAIPAKSPMFDKDWAASGHLERVVRDVGVDASKLAAAVVTHPTPSARFDVSLDVNGLVPQACLHPGCNKRPTFAATRSQPATHCEQHAPGEFTGSSNFPGGGGGFPGVSLHVQGVF